MIQSRQAKRSPTTARFRSAQCGFRTALTGRPASVNGFGKAPSADIRCGAFRLLMARRPGTVADLVIHRAGSPATGDAMD